jgi:hypothetical protein
VEGHAELLRGQSAIAVVVSHGEERVQQIRVDVGLAEDLHRRGVVDHAVGCAQTTNSRKLVITTKCLWYDVI